MAQRLTTRNGSTNLPGAYPSLQVLANTANFPGGGILLLLGESDAGPDWTLEDDLSQNFYTPDQFSNIQAKYRSGRLVDAAFGAIHPSQDPKLTGAPSAIYIIKTNASERAYAALPKIGGGTYHTLADKSYGAYGNLISYAATSKQTEVVPTTGSFTLLIPNNTTDISFRANGGTAVTYQLTTADLPPATVAGITALTGILATGGVNRTLLTVAGTIAVAVSSFQATFTRSVAWTNTPVVGDSLYIVAGSAIQGGTNRNRGSYVITSVTSTTIVATKLLDAAGAAGAVTAPEAVAATAVAATTDLAAFAPVIISLEAGDPLEGRGKALEANQLTSSTGRFVDLAYQLNTTPVTWISATGAPVQLTSSAEYKVGLADARTLDNVTENAVTPAGSTSIGGDIPVSIGYLGTTAVMTITPTTLTTTVTGGAGTSLSLKFTQFQTIGDLVSYIDAQPGYSATLLQPEYSARAPGTYKSTAVGWLDQLAAVGICSTFGEEPGRIKADARTYFNAVEGTSLVQLGLTTALNVPAAAGLPDVASGYLTGGALGATTQAQLAAAIDATAAISFNFGSLLIAQDATADIAEGLTDPASTYILEDSATYARLQAERLSTQFERMWRQWSVGIMGSYASVQRPFAIRQSTQGRLTIGFLELLALGPTASSVWQQPWYEAMLGFACQCAAFTRGIVHREPTQNGVRHVAGDYNINNRGDQSSALDSGLLPIARGIGNNTVAGSLGRYQFVSDQTAYIRDNNFYFNSMQAILLGDLLQSGFAQGVENGLIGETSADADDALAQKLGEALMAQALAARIIAPSNGAPRGYVAINVTQRGPSFFYKVVEAKLASLIYFAAIDFSVSQVERG